MRERRLARAFVELADTLVDDFDVIDFLHLLARHCVDLLDVHAAGLMLGDPHGRLQPAAVFSQDARLLELCAAGTEAGPCVDCYRTGLPVVNAGLGVPRWPHFTKAARAAGFVAVHALPLRLRGEVIGALTLFHRDSRTLSDADLHVGQALADISTISILSRRSHQEQETLAGQLQNALTSRIIIEQAKGMIAARLDLPVDEAFTVLRDHARSVQQGLSGLARRIADGDQEVWSALVRARPGASPNPNPNPAQAHGAD
jgi:transcriptional regulator with GAF, ATPase, and Fis domain